MKINSEKGSVLIMALLVMTVLAIICATSLTITSQNQSSSMQTASWHQSLAGAEIGVDRAIRALNTGSWTGWYNVSGTPSSTQPTPSGSPNANAAPISGQYNYFATSSGAPTLTMGGVSGTTGAPEGNTKVWGWVTVDPALVDSKGRQYYRIRSIGLAGADNLHGVSMNKLDNDLRNGIALRYNRKTNTAVAAGQAQASRTIEVIVKPNSNALWTRAVTLNGQIDMSGSSYIDSFDSSNPFKSTNGLYDSSKRQSNGDVGTLASTGSDLKSMYVYGSLTYSGPIPSNAGNVQGQKSTPFNAQITPVTSPGWTSGYTDKGTFSGSDTIPAGTKASPAKYKYTSLTVPGGGVYTLSAPNTGTDNNYVEIWITGKLTTSGSGYIVVSSGVNAIFHVGDDITVSGGSTLGPLVNQNGRAASVTINGYGGAGSKATISGSGAILAVVNAPNYAVTISGSGSFHGAVIGNTMSLSGSGGFHFDESLNNSGNSAYGNYSFASWFEDNSDPIRGVTY